MPTSYKQKVIEALFNSRWDPITGMLSRSEVTLEDVSVAIQAYNASLPANGRRISTRNPANFFKDIIRREIAFRHWPNLDPAGSARRARAVVESSAPTPAVLRGPC